MQTVLLNLLQLIIKQLLFWNQSSKHLLRFLSRGQGERKQDKKKTEKVSDDLSHKTSHFHFF